jgi:hypothetical protein
MKPKLYAVIFAWAAFCIYANAQTTLFDDTYTRANLNSGQTGGGGQTGADVGSGISYTIGQWNVAANSAYPGSTASVNNSGPNIVAQNNGTILKQNNGNMGIWSLNYNFTDAAILSAGGFSVSQDIVQLSGGTSQAQATDRYVGYGVGLNPTQVSNFQDDTASNNGPRGSLGANAGFPGQTTGGVAPFYVDLDLSGQVQVFEANSLGGTNSGLVFTSGTLVNPTSNPADLGMLTTDFSFSDFNAGSTVNYSVFLTTNNVTIAVTSGAFTWTSAGDNYIAGSMRGSTDIAGELNVSTIPEPSVCTMIFSGLGAISLFIRRRNL